MKDKIFIDAAFKCVGCCCIWTQIAKLNCVKPNQGTALSNCHECSQKTEYSICSGSSSFFTAPKTS